MTVETWCGYLLAALLLTMLPGLDTALVLRTAARGGVRPGIMAACGISLGCLCWGIMAAFGLGTLLAAWPSALTTLKLVGAAYIGWLGAALLLRPGTGLADVAFEAGGVLQSRDAFRRGFITNVLNPKVGAFYVTLIPQFVPEGSQSASVSMMLAMAHVVLAVVWFALLARLAGTLTPHLSKQSMASLIDRATGTVLIAFGVDLLLLR